MKKITQSIFGLKDVILQTTFISIVIISLHILIDKKITFIPSFDLMFGSMFAITISLMGLATSREETFNKITLGTKYFSLGIIGSFIFLIFFPKDLYGYIIAMIIIGYISILLNNNHYVALPLLIITILFFVIIPSHKNSNSTLYFPVLLFIEVVFGTMISLLGSTIVHRASNKKINFNKILYRIKVIYKTQGGSLANPINPVFYKIMLSISICLFIYEILTFYQIKVSPVYLINSSLVILQEEKDTPHHKGAHRIIGILVGSFIGILFSFLRWNLLFFTMGAPLIIVLTVIFNYLVLGKHVNITMTTLYMILISSSSITPVEYGINKLIWSMCGICIGLVVLKIWNTFISN